MVPERVKTFFWLVANQAIMTNVERKSDIYASQGFIKYAKEVMRQLYIFLGIVQRCQAFGIGLFRHGDVEASMKNHCWNGYMKI